MALFSLIRCAVILTLPFLAGCADQPAAPVAASAAKPPGFRIQGFLPETAPAAPTDSGASAATLPLRQNDPSAPADTPLCGVAAREANAAASVLSPAIEATGGACLATSCYDALTDTYIGADGFRHVCQ